MRILVKLGLIVTLTMSLLACATGPDVMSDYDHNANFASYRTFGFMSPLGTDSAGYETLVTERLKTATKLQLEQKGYRFDPNNPDLLVNFQMQVRKQTEFIPPPPMPWGPDYYGYRFGWYGVWPGYAFGPDVIQYTEGILNIDLIDAARKQLVWEGIAKAEISDPQQAKSAAFLDPLVADIFRKYPFLAGSGAVQAAK